MTGVKEGSVKITVKTDDGGKTSTATITVNIHVASVSISPNDSNVPNPIMVAQGTSTYLTAVITPSNAFNQDVTWEVSPSVANISVDANGKVSVGNGVSPNTTATIKVTTTDQSKTAQASIEVVKASPEAMVAVPTNGSTGITFPMGTTDGDTGTIKHKFAMAQTEVTYELWKKVHDWANTTEGTCVSATGQYCYTFANAGKQGGIYTSNGDEEGNPAGSNKQPVTSVSWHDAIVWSNAYTEWYNAVKGGSLTVVYKKSGTPLRDATNDADVNGLGKTFDPTTNTATGFRLPTSQEWEFAARLRKDTTNCVKTGGLCKSVSIGSTTYYFTKGNSVSGGSKAYNATGTDIGDFAWYEENSCDAGTGCSTDSTGTKQSKSHDVATKTANALGLYDMSGNVWEWCFDIFGGGSERVNRGGSWYGVIDDGYGLQVGYVINGSPGYGPVYLGFRVARTVP